MPRRPRGQGRNQAAAPGYARLERRLSLLAWLRHLLGYSDTRELLDDISDVNEGFTSEGQSNVFVHMEARSNRLRGVTIDDLRRYDANIGAHLAAMNAGRIEPIALRYFQYLAALHAEIYLDRYFPSPDNLLAQLNDFVRRHNATRRPDERFDAYEQSDLRKLAFWMATGSGKTLLLHLNYRQFLHYNRMRGQPIDNVLLITPNEGLSRQHIDELAASNIAAARFDLDRAGLTLTAPDNVQVTEITKLVEEKRGGGIRVPVEAFEGNNLIFVDEGHKGAGGDAWRHMRDTLAETGFTFEYSATFGQALAAAKNADLIAEYGKAIAFDYSYRHFYNDGYGKDFRILNLRQHSGGDDADLLLMANMLSFYEQTRAFEEQEAALRPYNLERPLWTFIGGSVNAVYRESNRPRSDILTVARFLHRTLSQPEWAQDAISLILDGKSGLLNEMGRDIFADKFGYLRGKIASDGLAVVFGDMLRRLMHAPSSGGLRICHLRGNSDELGLKAAGSDHYFGVIYIGDTAAFKGLVEAEGDGISIEDDVLAESLFDRINDAGDGAPPVQVLIGARKFIEGWNSWRVSNMGLLNIGQSEGSQIIQLFGRGVRLKGVDMSLRRSAALVPQPDPPPSDNIRLLETLNIFSVRANYMAAFREYLSNEGVPLEEFAQLEFPVEVNQDFLNQGLVIPRLPEGLRFIDETEVALRHDPGVSPVAVSASMVAQEVFSNQGDIDETAAQSGADKRIPPESLDLVDWDAAYIDLMEYRDEKGYGNLAIQPAELRGIIAAGESSYSLVADDAVIRPRSMADRKRLQGVVVSILRRYADALYGRRQRQWESSHMTYMPVDEHDANLRFNIGEDGARSRYIVHAPPDVLEEMRKLIEDCNALYADDLEDANARRIHFDRHFYQPLLAQGGRGNRQIKASPPALAESELTFVKHLRRFWDNRRDELPCDTEIFLLRNLGRGKGIGFFANEGFYPDFILWVKSARGQRIVFVEPHGMVHANAYSQDNKATLHEWLRAMEPDIELRSSVKNVRLDSYIVSATSYDNLRQKYDTGDWSKDRFEDRHILFPDDDGEYVARILNDGS